jgi:hypothetical protein
VSLLGVNETKYSFGVLLNAVEFNSVAAEPLPHEISRSSSVNWE